MFLRVSNPNLVLNINCFPLPSFLFSGIFTVLYLSGHYSVGFLVVLCSATWSVFLRPVGILDLVMFKFILVICLDPLDSMLKILLWELMRTRLLLERVEPEMVTLPSKKTTKSKHFPALQTYCRFPPHLPTSPPPSRKQSVPSVQFFSQRYLRRRKYKLFACFLEASMVACTDGHITFEISIGKVHLW